MTRTKRTVIQTFEENDTGAREMAAARLSLEAIGSLNRAVEAAGISFTDLATRLGVGVSRVSQVLGGEGNLRLSTYARYLRAAGYRARLVIEPASTAVPSIERPALGRQPRKTRSARMFHFDAAQSVSAELADALNLTVVYGFTATSTGAHHARTVPIGPLVEQIPPRNRDRFFDVDIAFGAEGTKSGVNGGLHV